MNIDLSGLPDTNDMPTERLPDTNAEVLRTAYRQNQPGPEQYGKIRSLSTNTGIPRPVVGRNLSLVEKRSQEPDWNQLESTAPILTRELASSLDLFHLAKDDTENLSLWEREVKSMADFFFDVDAGFKSGAMTDELGLLGYQMQQGRDTPETRARIKDLNQRMEVWKGSGGFAENAAKILGQMVQGIPEIATFAAGTALTAGGAVALGGQMGPQVMLPEEVVTVPLATTAGFASGYLVKSGERAHRIEAGHSYLDMLEQNIDPEIAANVATGVGLFNAALEMSGMAAVGAPLKRALGKMFAEKATQVLAQQTTTQAAKRFARDYTTAWLVETGTEVAQEVVSVLGEEIAKQLDPKDLESLLASDEGREQIMERLGAIFEEVGKGMAILALPGASINFRADLQRAQAAQENVDRILALGDNAQASKLRERSPELFQEYVDKLAAGGPVENVYVDAEQFSTFFQSKGIDPLEAAAEIPSVKAQLEEALNTRGDLVIPLGEYASKIAATEYHQELSEHIRLRPEDMSAAEAKQWQKESSEEFQREAETVLEEQAESDALQESADKVYQSIRDDIVSTGRFTEDVADAYATLHRNFAITMADRLGMQPHEIYERYILRTRVPPLTAEPSPPPGEAAAGGTLLDQAKSEGYEGEVISEASEWVKAKEKGLDMAEEARMARAREMDFDMGMVFTHESPKSEQITEIKSGGKFGGIFSLEGDRAGYYENIQDFVVRGGVASSSNLSEYVSENWDETEKWIQSRSSEKLTDEEVEQIIDYAITEDNLPLEGHEDWDRMSDIFRAIDTAEMYAELQKLRGELAVRAGFGAVEAEDEFGRSIMLLPGSMVRSINAAFDPDQKESTNLLAQAKRGTIAFPPDITQAPSIITLMEDANLSTFLHESGHFFFEVMTDIAGREDGPAQIKDDVQKLMDWYGVADLSTWQGMDIEQRRQYHEQFARGFEAYLFEGKSPNLEMQGLFSRFRSWLLAVYRTVRNLNVKLTDEVRGVMDRLLATDEQIEIAQSVQNYRPLFESADQAGMTETEWAEYLRGDASATREAKDQLAERSLREMRWLANAKSKIVKELQRDAKERRTAVRKEVAEQVAAEPVYRAIRWLRKGELTTDSGEEIKSDKGFRLDVGALEEMYPPGEIAELNWKPALRGMTIKRERSKDESGNVTETAAGLHPNLVAEMFGFTSGDHLVRSIAEAEPINDVIEDRTDTAMLERYGDITDPVAMERAAEEAIHNDARAKFVAAEHAALAKLVGGRKILADAAKSYADSKILDKKVRDAIKSGQYLSAERKAGTEAEKAMRRSDPDQAALHKRAQLLNMYMYRASESARKDVEKMVRYFRKFDRKAIRKNIGQSYIDQIDRLLEAFDFRRVSDRDLRRRESLSNWIESQTAIGLEPVIDDRLLGDLAKRHYRDVTMEEIYGLYDSVKSIEHLAKLKNKLLTVQKKRRFEEVVETVVRTIRTNKAPVEIPIETRLPQDTAIQAVGSFFASHRKFSSFIRQMDGFKDGGPMWEIFLKPLNLASDKEASEREKATKRLSEIFGMYGSTDIKSMYIPKYIPEINKSLTKQGRLTVALNWGNEANRQRISDGYGWNAQQIEVIFSTLDKRDWDFVQAVWDFIDEYWPLIAEKEKRVTGLTPEKVEAAPVFTRWGEYRGGYFPIKYDDRQSPRAFADNAKEMADQSIRGAYARAATRRGHTKARVEKVKRPIRLDFGVIFEHVEQVVHDLAFHEYLIDANRLMGEERIQRAILETHGHEIYQQMKNTITDVAAGDVPAQTTFQAGINWIRAGASIAAMGWNLGTALLQPFGLTQSMVRIGPKWVGKGLSRWLRDASSMENTVAWIHDRSDFMRLRGITMQREINEIRNKVSAQSPRRRILGPFEDTYFWLILKGQMIADVPTWLGQYEKSMADGRSESDSISLADQAVLDSQGGGQIKDLAQIQRGGPLMKLWTNFYSYFNVTYNLTSESIARTNFKKPESVGRLAVDMFLLYTAPAVLGWFLRSALIKGECEGGSDIECVAEKLAREQLGYLTGTMVGLREMGSFVQGYYGYEGPAGARAFSEVGNLIQQAEQGEADEAFWKSLNNTAGVLLHYPAGQAQRTAEGIAALTEGDTANPFVILTGPPKE